MKNLINYIQAIIFFGLLLFLTNCDNKHRNSERDTIETTNVVAVVDEQNVEKIREKVIRVPNDFNPNLPIEKVHNLNLRDMVITKYYSFQKKIKSD